MKFRPLLKFASDREFIRGLNKVQIHIDMHGDSGDNLTFKSLEEKSQKSSIKTAMILAAGLGLRMRPLTENLPKPLVKLYNKPLIDYLIEKLIEVGVEKIIINTHYKAEILEEHLKKFHDKIEIIISFEKELLDSAGGVINVLPHFNNQLFYLMNSDVIWIEKNFNFLKYLNEKWNEYSDIECLMVLINKEKYHGYDRNGDFNIINDKIIYPYDDKERMLAFPGFRIMHPNFFQNEEIASKRFFDDILFKKDRLNKTKSIIIDNPNIEFLHIGTVEGLKLAEEKYKILKK